MWKQRILLNVVARCLEHEPKKLNFIGLKNGRASYSNSDSLCPPPYPSPKETPPCPPPYPSPKEPPPCPPPPPPCGPPCPPPICVDVPDPHDPCNYVRPEDPDALDLTKLKRSQCLYQQDNDTPTYLKGGKVNVYLYQALVIMSGINFIYSIYALYELTQAYK